MKTSLSGIASLALMLTGGILLAGDLSLEFQPDGSCRLDNGLIRLDLRNRPGQDNGIANWSFKPVGEMVDVLYGQTDYVKGHLLGERWDPVDFQGYPQGAPAAGGVYATQSQGVSDDGRALVLDQSAEAAYRLSRVSVLRRGLAMAEFRYRLENKRGAPAGCSLRFHSAMSPGSRGKYQDKNATLFLDTESGLLELDQTLPSGAFHARYGTDKFFNANRTNEPPRNWVSPAAITSAVLRADWAAWVNRGNGDGMVLLFEPGKLLGFYNCPGTTLEPVLRSFALRTGETWGVTAYVGSFTGAKGKAICGATPLYVVTAALVAKDGALAGELIPLFEGTLRVLNGAGKTVSESPAAPDKPLPVNARLAGEAWTLVALDPAGAEIGRADSAGRCALADPNVTPKAVKKPAVKGDVYLAPEAEAAIAAFVAGGQYAVQCDDRSPAAEKAAAKDLAAALKTGLLWTAPDMAVLAVGDPAGSDTIRDIGLLKQTVTADWPGAGKGAILFHPSIEQTRQPAVVIAGSDEAGVLKAAAEFKARFAARAPAREPFALWPATPALKVYPYTPAPVTNAAGKLALTAARGEYEPAQAVITAFENLENLEVTVAPLVNARTGAPVKWSYARAPRKRNGPLWLRWVRTFPLKPENGWTGYPDPITEKGDTRIEAGRSQGLWLTAIVGDNAEPGLYASTLTIRANGLEKTIPIELTVLDFALPAEGLKGEPYMTFANFPPDDRRDLGDRQVEALVNNMVEHGMRFLHLTALDMCRWHFSTNGAFKGMATDWLEPSDDGTVLFDAGRLDWLIGQCDAVAKPFKLDYMLYLQGVIDGVDGGYGRFKRTFPARFKDQPAREGHYSGDYYAQEMLSLLRRHLERRGWLDRVVLKAGDEPPSFDAWWRSTTAAREAGIPLMTCFNQIDWKDAEKGLGVLKVWQPLYMLYDKAFFDKARAAGARISWYNCGPPPKTSVQTGAPELRAYLWQAAKADLDIVAWWGIQCWSYNNVWEDRYSHWNSVVYPNHAKWPAWQKPGKSWVDTAPIDSLRWEHIRDGMEDAWYVNLLRADIKKARERGLTAEADKAQVVLDAIWAEVFPTLNDYNPPYEKLMECRARVAEAILALQKALPK